MAPGARQSFGRFVAADSALHRMDSLAKVAVFALALASAIAASSLASLAVVAAYVVGLCALSRVGGAHYAGGLKAFAWMFALSFAINAAFPGRPSEPLSGSALLAASLLAARLAVMILAASLFTAVTGPSEIGDAVMQLSRARGRVGRRAAEAAALLSVSLRFVPVLFEEAERIRAAQVLRGARARGLGGRIGSVVGVVVPLVEASLGRAVNLGFALEARCYGYKVPVPGPVRLGRREVALLAASGALLYVTLALN